MSRHMKMIHPDTQFTEYRSENSPLRRIAYDVSAGQADKPGLFWLSGFKSDMRSQKVTEITDWARENDIGMCRFDYSGHGESDGVFEEGLISHWLEDALHVFETQTKGPQILVGSSMGGWIAMLLMRKLLAVGKGRFAGCVMIAPAWDMTEALMWLRFPDDVKKQVLETGRYERPSAYDDGPYVLTRALIEDGRNHLLGEKRVRFDCPIRIIHGIQDPDVPSSHSEKLIAHLLDEDVVLSLVKDAEHRLSRPHDIRRLICEIEQLIMK